MNKSQLKELIKEEIRTALKEESKSKEFELEIINKNGTRTTQKVMADPSTTELFRIVAGIKKSPNVKDVRIKEEIKKSLKEFYTDVAPDFDPALLGPQIMNAAQEYARDKSNNPNEEKALAKAFIAGILWKTKN